MSMARKQKAQKALANSDPKNDFSQYYRDLLYGSWMASGCITGDGLTEYTFVIVNGQELTDSGYFWSDKLNRYGSNGYINGQELTQCKWNISLPQNLKKFITSSGISCIVYLAKEIHNRCFGITFKDLEGSDFNKDYTFNVHLKILQCYKGKAILFFGFFGKSFFDDITADEEKIAKGNIIWENIIHQCGLDLVINQRVWKIFIFDAIIFHHLSASFNCVHDFYHLYHLADFSKVVDITRTFIFMNQTNKKVMEENEITKLFEKVYNCFSMMSSVKQ